MRGRGVVRVDIRVRSACCDPKTPLRRLRGAKHHKVLQPHFAAVLAVLIWDF